MYESKLTYYQDKNIVLYHDDLDDIKFKKLVKLHPILQNLGYGITYNSFKDLPMYVHGMSFRVIILWNGIKYPNDKIKHIHERTEVFNKTINVMFNMDEIKIPYTLININFIKHFKLGLKLLYKYKIYKTLTNLTYKYWYEVLNKEGLSRMCLKDNTI